MNIFSQRHYIAIADTIGLTLRQIDQDTEPGQEVTTRPARYKFHRTMAINRLLDNLDVTFKEDNPKFKPDVFGTRVGLVRREGLQS